MLNRFLVWVDLAGGNDSYPLRESVVRRCFGEHPIAYQGQSLQGTCTFAERHLDFNSRPFMPPANGVNSIQILFDGRLDHRERLASELGLRPEEHDDAGLIQAAYRRWDSEWTDHIHGSLAAVVVDESRHRLVASRDELGRAPLFYVLTDTMLLLASSPDLLLRHPAVTPRHDPLWLAAYFAMQPTAAEPERSPFTAIRLLRPNQRLIWAQNQGVRFETGRFRLGRQRLRFNRDEDYAEGFRERLSAAIVDRTRGIEKLGILLSGGMDSCPVGCLSAEHFRHSGQSLTAYSWTLGRFPEADETRELSECADFAGIPTVLLPADELLPFADPLDWPMDLNAPLANPYWPLFRMVYQRAAADGCRVLLQGTLGDELYPQNWMLADALTDGRLMLAAEEFGALLGRVGWRGLLGAPALRNCGKRLLRWRRRAPPILPNWLTPQAGNQLLPPEAPPVFHARPDQYQNLVGSHVFQQQVGHQVDATDHGIYRLDPFTDWDLIDYMLAIPAYQTRRLGQTKFLARNAMKGRMPESLRLRPRGSLLNTFYYAGFEQSRCNIREFLGRSDCTWPDYVRRDVLMASLEQPSPPDRLKVVSERALSYEVWNRRLEQLPGR